MWMATGRYGTWIPCPQSPLEGTYNGQSEVTELMNGGAYVRRTIASHLTWNPVWDDKPEELRPIKDLYDGIYGEGPFYFVDPTVARNALPPHWAAPSLSAKDWPALMYERRPTLLYSTINPGYRTPVQMATYAIPATAPVLNYLTPKATLVVPPTHSLNLRVWGYRTGSAVIRVTLYNRDTGATVQHNVVPNVLGASLKIFGQEYSHADIWITKTDTSASTITLAGLLASVTITDTVSTYWTSGEGNSGVQWVGELGNTVYQAGIRHSMSATWVEVGAWLW